MSRCEENFVLCTCHVAKRIIVSRWLKYERSEKQVSHARGPRGEAHVYIGHAPSDVHLLSFAAKTVSSPPTTPM